MEPRWDVGEQGVVGRDTFRGFNNDLETLDLFNVESGARIGAGGKHGYKWQQFSIWDGRNNSVKRRRDQVIHTQTHSHTLYACLKAAVNVLHSCRNGWVA